MLVASRGAFPGNGVDWSEQCHETIYSFKMLGDIRVALETSPLVGLANQDASCCSSETGATGSA